MNIISTINMLLILVCSDLCSNQQLGEEVSTRQLESLEDQFVTEIQINSSETVTLKQFRSPYDVIHIISRDTSDLIEVMASGLMDYQSSRIAISRSLDILKATNKYNTIKGNDIIFCTFEFSAICQAQFSSRIIRGDKIYLSYLTEGISPNIILTLQQTNYPSIINSYIIFDSKLSLEAQIPVPSLVELTTIKLEFNQIKSQIISERSLIFEITLLNQEGDILLTDTSPKLIQVYDRKELNEIQQLETFQGGYLYDKKLIFGQIFIKENSSNYISNNSSILMEIELIQTLNTKISFQEPIRVSVRLRSAASIENPILLTTMAYLPISLKSRINEVGMWHPLFNDFTLQGQPFIGIKITIYTGELLDRIVESDYIVSVFLNLQDLINRTAAYMIFTAEEKDKFVSFEALNNHENNKQIQHNFNILFIIVENKSGTADNEQDIVAISTTLIRSKTSKSNTEEKQVQSMIALVLVSIGIFLIATCIILLRRWQSQNFTKRQKYQVEPNSLDDEKNVKQSETRAQAIVQKPIPSINKNEQDDSLEESEHKSCVLEMESNQNVNGSFSRRKRKGNDRARLISQTSVQNSQVSLRMNKSKKNNLRIEIEDTIDDEANQMQQQKQMIIQQMQMRAKQKMMADRAAASSGLKRGVEQ